jgi:hypothetical protein
MIRSILSRRFVAMSLLATCMALIAPQASSAKQKPPQVTEDGLELKKQTRQRLVYARPGATFTQFQRVAILDCYVAFSETWLRDYNNSVRDLSRKIGNDDLERARQDLGKQFMKIFSEELRIGGYQISDAAEPDVLVLRPALINIQVNAPDLMTPGRTTTYAESSGQMTLHLELLDASTATVLARVIDAQADSSAFGQRTTSVDNQAAADRILRDWAVELRKKLDVVRGKT